VSRNNPEHQSVLIVSEHSNPDKIKRHWEPLGNVTNDATMVCLTPSEDTDLNFVQVPTFGNRLFGILLLFPYALKERITGSYDLVVAASLFPYGLYALTVGVLSRTPTHLLILGIDLDAHAEAWYGRLPQMAFRRFNSISVLGTEHQRQIEQYGVCSKDVLKLANTIDTEKYTPEVMSENPQYDFVWSGRFSSEKDPIIFIEALEELQSRGHEVNAVMLGEGELMEKIKKHRIDSGLSDTVSLPGWIENPVDYYAESEIFTLTSRRDALALSLLESMAMGLACIAPRVGNIPDVATGEENALLVEDHSAEAFADAMEKLLTNDRLRNRIGDNAIKTGQSFSYEQAQKDWKRIVTYTVDN